MSKYQNLLTVLLIATYFPPLEEGYKWPTLEKHSVDKDGWRLFFVEINVAYILRTKVYPVNTKTSYGTDWLSY